MSVLNIIRKLQEREREIRLLILGLDNAGKTTVLQRFLNDDIDEISPTVGFNIKTFQYNPANPPHPPPSPSTQIDETNTLPLSNSSSERDPFHVTIWDIGGQSTIRSFWSNYFSHTDGLVWVIDSTDVCRFELCVETLKQVLKQEKLSGVSLLILANKQDVPFASSLETICELLGCEPKTDQQQQPSSGLHLSHHWFIYGCSALQNVGIHDGFNMLITDIINRLYSIE
jgi:ADP-ribosylation factor-like protein 2